MEFYITYDASLYNCSTIHNVDKQYTSLSSSPFTANFTNSSTVYDNSKFRANKYFLMGVGYLYFNRVTWTTGGSFYVDMPVTIPGNLNDGHHTEYNILVYETYTRTTSQACIDVYQTYLRFRIYMNALGSSAYTVGFFIPGIVMRYIW